MAGARERAEWSSVLVFNVLIYRDDLCEGISIPCVHNKNLWK